MMCPTSLFPSLQMEEHVIIGGSVDKTTATLTQSPITSVTVHKSGAVITRTLRLLLEASPENATRRHSGHEVRIATAWPASGL